MTTALKLPNMGKSKKCWRCEGDLPDTRELMVKCQKCGSWNDTSQMIAYPRVPHPTKRTTTAPG